MDAMSAKDEILQRVRNGVGKPDFAARRVLAEAYLAARTRGPQPQIAADLAVRFQQKAEYLVSTVEVVANSGAAPAAVARYLAANQLGQQAVCTHDVLELNWAEQGLSVAARAAVDADLVGISGCFCAIAETGTLLLLSGPQTPATVSLLPETHIALVPMARLVPTMEDAFALLQREHGKLPRAVNFISGPSRTGDIEQTLILGAHGPCRVHLILLESQ